ncbi:DUF937 domain-containing protein [Hansschlegelia sp.]|uniref:DUF937 domain-containing protein n=1 Tax=Hansschlegelia sp. TaxID=2041892 RepID=UPI002C4DF276|nr:DUF937 domain-containing protein [Hansschlegelia sp.]HVI30068.1 DUF937 domain-containing protein [Hansschlegelia sp.]
MINMFELLRQAQGGAAFDNLARAYGMSPEQIRAAVAALTPAFAQGFQRQPQNDQAARRFAELLQTETYARAFEAQAAAFDQAATSAGEEALGALFGSKEVSRAVAAQAAAASGVQAEIIRKVLPALASILVGGFAKAAQGAAGGGATSGFPGALGAFWGEAMRAASGASQTPAGEAPHNPFEEWMRGFGQAGAKAGADRPQEGGAMMMGDMMAEMLNGMFGGAPSRKPPEDQKEPPAGTGDEPRPAGTATGAFDELVETGRELSAQNARAMEQIFDAFFGPKEPKA